MGGDYTVVMLLAALCKAVEAGEPMPERVSNWWERYKEQEKERKKREHLLATAKSKLSAEELEVLNIF